MAGTIKNAMYTIGMWLNRPSPSTGIADRPGIFSVWNTSIAGTSELTPNMMRNSVADRPDPSTLIAAPTTVWFARSVTVSSANSAPTAAPDAMANSRPTHTLPLT